MLEFAGDGLRDWALDERATLTNMAVEAGGTTGIIEPDEVTLEYIVRTRGLDPETVRRGFLRSDPEAQYAAVFEINLEDIHPMVATPGDPRNGIKIEDLAEEIKIDTAYGGSCTGGKMADMDMYAVVFRRAVAHAARRAGRASLPAIRLAEEQSICAERGYIEISSGRAELMTRAARVHQCRSGGGKVARSSLLARRIELTAAAAPAK